MMKVSRDLISIALECVTAVICLAKFSELSNVVELRRHELGLLADRLGQSSHSQLENKLAETLKGLEEEGQAVEAAKAAGAAAAAK